MGPPACARKAGTSRWDASVAQGLAMPLGVAPPPNWRRKADTSRFSMFWVTSRPSPQADTSTWATFQEMPRCAPAAATCAPAKSEGARNWKLQAATSPSLTLEILSACAPAAGRSISAKFAVLCMPRRAGAAYASCTFPVRWNWSRAAAASA